RPALCRAPPTLAPSSTKHRLIVILSFHDIRATDIYPLSLHDALPISDLLLFQRACTKWIFIKHIGPTRQYSTLFHRENDRYSRPQAGYDIRSIPAKRYEN